MTAAQINRAIAEATGWEFIPSHDAWNGAVPEAWQDLCGDRHYEGTPYPEYNKDLEEMAEAEFAVLTEVQRHLFVILLLGITGGIGKGETIGCWHCIHATAAQRAEAFLRTIGKWKEAQ